MKNKNYKKAFTLIELLTVVVIIGLISSIALITLRDTGEIKAKQYTSQLIKGIKNGIAFKEDSQTFSGFLNDFGTLPPNIYFLINKEHENNFIYTQIPDKLDKFKLRDVFKVKENSNENKIPMPFIEIDPTKRDSLDHDGDSATANKTFFTDGDLRKYFTKNSGDNLNANLEDSLYQNKSAILSLYTGYLGGYVQTEIDSDDEKPLKDGWNTVLGIDIDMSLDNPDDYPDKSFLQVLSFGSDKLDNNKPQLLRNEFNETLDTSRTKSVFKDDIVGNYKREYFIPKGLTIDLDFKDDDNIGKVKVLIYSPMLYYVEGANDVECAVLNNQEADCSSLTPTNRKYIPYLAYHPDFKTYPIPDKPNWAAGVIKYDFELNYSNMTETSDNKLSINNTRYNFNNNSDKAVGTTAFINEISITSENGKKSASSDNSVDDDANKFYITAGEKHIVILREKSGKWEYVDSFTKVFMPNKTVTIKYPQP